MKAKSEVMKDLARVRRRKIVIQKKTVVEDEWFNQVETWVDWQEVWAERSNLWGESYYAARAVNEENTVEFTIRYASFVEQIDTTNYQIVFEGRAYSIEQIDHLKDDGLWVKLKCLERGANG